MKEKQSEYISSLLDNELHQEDIQHIIHTVEHEENSGHKLDRYALIGDALRDETVVVYEESFLNKIKEALDDEPVVLAPRAARKQSDRPFVAIAIAASFAFLSILIFNIFPEVETNVGGQPYAEATQEQGTQLVMDSDEPENLNLQEYLRKHKKFSPLHDERIDTRLVTFGKD